MAFRYPRSTFPRAGEPSVVASIPWFLLALTWGGIGYVLVQVREVASTVVELIRAYREEISLLRDQVHRNDLYGRKLREYIDAKCDEIERQLPSIEC
jgi:hypothetical protein